MSEYENICEVFDTNDQKTANLLLANNWRLLNTYTKAYDKPGDLDLFYVLGKPSGIFYTAKQAVDEASPYKNFKNYSAE